MEKTQTKQVSSDIITSLMNGFILSLMYFDYAVIEIGQLCSGKRKKHKDVTINFFLRA